MPDLIRFPLVLCIVSALSAAILAAIYGVARPRIEAQKELREREAIRIVFPGAASTEKRSFALPGADGEKPRTIEYREVRGGDGSLAGYIAKGTASGYSSAIEVLVGLRPDLAVAGIKILFEQETPGLGTRIEEVESDATWLKILTGRGASGRQEGEPEPLPWFTARLLGLMPEELRLTSEGGKVDAITGATISSRAVAAAARAAAEDVRRATAGGVR